MRRAIRRLHFELALLDAAASSFLLWSNWGLVLLLLLEDAGDAALLVRPRGGCLEGGVW